MRDERGKFLGAVSSSERVRGARRDLEHARDQARKAVVRAARAAERVGFSMAWVKRLAKRLAQPRGGVEVNQRRPRVVATSNAGDTSSV